MDLHHQLPLILGLLLVVTLLSLAARRVHMPYPTVMVLGGLAICFIPHLQPIHLDPDAVFLLFLPPLLYSAAWQTSWKEFKANLPSITLLAVGFVLFTTFAVGWYAHWLIPSMSWQVALTLGAIISPPDAVAATAIAERLRIPRRIVTVLEGESLLNDATGLTIYRFAVAAAVTGSFSLASASYHFILAAGGGAVLGLLLGLLVAQVHKRLDDPLVETVFTLLTPFSAYLIAEALQVSGVLAVVVTGLYMSRRSSQLFSHKTRIMANAVWEVFNFVLNGLVFILIGLELPEVLHQDSGLSAKLLLEYAVLFSVLIVIVRFIWIFPAAYIPRKLFPFIYRGSTTPHWTAVFIVGYAGMRGVDSLAAALAIPLVIASGVPFPYRNLIIFLTFAVILSTLVVQSLTLPPLIRLLRLKEEEGSHCDENEARLRAARAGLACIDVLAAEPETHGPTLERIRRQYEDRIALLQTRCALPAVPGADGRPTPEFDYVAHAHSLKRRLIDAQRDHLIDMRDRSIIGDEILHAIERDLDLEEARLS